MHLKEARSYTFGIIVHRQLLLLLLFIEYATIAGHYKNMYTH